MDQRFINSVLPKLGLEHILRMSKPPLWLSYARKGDVLHVVFEEAKKQDNENKSC